MLSHSLILIGFMASGKSHVARLLSKYSDAPVIDLDKRIEMVLGDSIPRVFSVHGEKYFRDRENEILQQVLAETSTHPAIISTGGGVVTNVKNRRLLLQASENGALVIYLRAAPQTLAQRIRQEPGKRPLIDGESILDLEQTVERVKVLLEARRKLYESCANMVIDTDLLGAPEVAMTIMEKISLKP